LQDHDYELDWDNMDWMPDPIDAGPEFKRSKVEDVFTHLFNLFDRENLIDELKSILGEFLLRAKENSDFDTVIKLLELFKSRIGEDKLQSCEVMLHDVEASRRINIAVHGSESYMAGSGRLGQPEINAQVLSAFFWPTLRDLHIKMPEPMRRIQEVYEIGFRSIKDMRRVEWMNALGQIEIELQLEDRVIQEKVTPLVAAVIQCFDQENGKSRADASRIAEQLEISEEDIVRNALDFWVGKGVLRKCDATGEAYEVVERLDNLQADDALASTAAADNEQQALINQKALLYKQFIIAMLTNNGNLPVARISMMLKIALPGGFPFSNDLLESLLKSMVKEGALVTQGGVFGIKKP
jgi:anaphase-promoting complex subunit 2